MPPLEHVQPEDPQHLESAFTLLRWHSDAVKYYLTYIVFPAITKSKSQKLSASGQELGTDLLFGVRLG